MSREISLVPGALPDNPPGLDQINYRSGTYGSFLVGMQQAVGRERRYLTDLNTRDGDDPAIALLDAWAVAGDVLSFYAERIANEAYLGTALERRSIRSLARLVDYELRPGKAAETWVAITVEDAPGAPESVPIPRGVKINSVPGPDEQMVTFETVEGIEAHPWLNAMRPQTTREQTLDDVAATHRVLVTGLLTDVRRGDWLVTVRGSDSSLTRVETVTADTTTGTTTIDHVPNPPILVVRLAARLLRAPITFSAHPYGVSQPFVEQEIHSVSRSQPAFEARLRQRRVAPQLVRRLLFERPHEGLPAEEGVFRFRARAAVFGHNTPADDEGVAHIPALGDGRSTVSTVALDREYPEVRPGSYIAFDTRDASHVAKVTSVWTTTAQHERLTSRVSRVDFTPALDVDWSTVRASQVVVLVDSEELPLARLAVTEPVDGSSILLDAYYPQLVEGGPVAVTGERADLDGVEETSVHTIRTVTLQDGLTHLDLTTALPWPLRRDDVRINANLVRATHGERGGRPIGHGDSTKAGQRFPLPTKPLTHVSADTLTGVAPELEVWVEGVRWRRVESLRDAGPLDRAYSLSYQEDGTVVVVTGDGINGRRIPTGTDNVVATWRTGQGPSGLVRAGQLSLPADKPQGVRGVTNATAAVGAVASQSADDARGAAPLTVLTMGRIVTLRDYADFATGFGGITKAHAAWLWSGSSRSVFLTVAGADGAFVPDDDLVLLRTVISRISDPATGLTIAPFRPAWFHLEAGIAVLPGYTATSVLPRMEATLRARFGFTARELGQPAARSEVIAQAQAVEGVDWIDVDAFHRGDTPGNHSVLTAAMPQNGRRVARLGMPHGAELLALDPTPLNLRAIS